MVGVSPPLCSIYTTDVAQVPQMCCISEQGLSESRVLHKWTQV